MSPYLSPGQTAAQKLADFICALDHSHIRPEAVARCRELLLDQLGCQLVGASVPWNQPVYRFVKDTKSGGPARIVKYGDKVPLGQRRFACHMKIHLSDGNGVDGSLAAPKGSYKNPLTESELHDKFYRLGSSVLDDDRLSSIVDSVEGIEKSENVGSICVLTTTTS